MSIDPDAQDYIDQVLVVDGFMWPHVQEAINRFVVGCKSDPSPNPGVSNWDAFRACCLMAGTATLESALIPLKGPAPTNNNFNQDDYHQVLGLKGNLVNKWLDSNIDHSTLVVENSSLSIFVTEPEDSSINTIHTLMGYNPGTGNRFRLTRSSTGLIRGMFPGSSAVVTVPEITTGFWGGSRATPSIAYGRYGGITYTTNNFLGGGWASRNLRVFRAHDSGFPTDARIAYYHIGEAVDLELLDKRVSRYLKDIATPARRGFPLSRLVN